ncbi:hypothetical protein D9M70_475810 [compost metagenome]
MLLVELLPLVHLADRLVQRLEVIAKLLHQVLVEILNHLTQRLDHRLGGRLGQHLAELIQLHEKLVLELAVSTIQSIAEIAHVGTHQLELARHRTFLITGKRLVESFQQFDLLGQHAMDMLGRDAVRLLRTAAGRGKPPGIQRL